MLALGFFLLMSMAASNPQVGRLPLVGQLSQGLAGSDCSIGRQIGDKLLKLVDKLVEKHHLSFNQGVELFEDWKRKASLSGKKEECLTEEFLNRFTDSKLEGFKAARITSLAQSSSTATSKATDSIDSIRRMREVKMMVLERKFDSKAKELSSDVTRLEEEIEGANQDIRQMKGKCQCVRTGQILSRLSALRRRRVHYIREKSFIQIRKIEAKVSATKKFLRTLKDLLKSTKDPEKLKEIKFFVKSTTSKLKRLRKKQSKQEKKFLSELKTRKATLKKEIEVLVLRSKGPLSPIERMKVSLRLQSLKKSLIFEWKQQVKINSMIIKERIKDMKAKLRDPHLSPGERKRILTMIKRLKAKKEKAKRHLMKWVLKEKIRAKGAKLQRITNRINKLKEQLQFISDGPQKAALLKRIAKLEKKQRKILSKKEKFVIKELRVEIKRLKYLRDNAKTPEQKRKIMKKLKALKKKMKAAKKLMRSAKMSKSSRLDVKIAAKKRELLIIKEEMATVKDPKILKKLKLKELILIRKINRVKLKKQKLKVLRLQEKMRKLREHLEDIKDPVLRAHILKRLERLSKKVNKVKRRMKGILKKLRRARITKDFLMRKKANSIKEKIRRLKEKISRTTDPKKLSHLKKKLEKAHLKLAITIKKLQRARIRHESRKIKHLQELLKKTKDPAIIKSIQSKLNSFITRRAASILQYKKADSKLRKIRKARLAKLKQKSDALMSKISSFFSAPATEGQKQEQHHFIKKFIHLQVKSYKIQLKLQHSQYINLLLIKRKLTPEEKKRMNKVRASILKSIVEGFTSPRVLPCKQRISQLESLILANMKLLEKIKEKKFKEDVDWAIKGNQKKLSVVKEICGLDLMKDLPSSEGCPCCGETIKMFQGRIEYLNEQILHLHKEKDERVQNNKLLLSLA